MLAKQLREYFNLIPHPEGGFYCRTYQSTELIHEECLPLRFSGERHYSTSIYYLLEDTQYSAFHRLLSDELWHFYAGSPLNIYMIDERGSFELATLGNNFTNGEVFQAVVKAGNWFAAQPVRPGSFSFVGCTLSPGFDFSDIVYADPDNLSHDFPQHEQLIRRFCR
jgi:predicted cupin superfamily sugar epimerase